MEKSKKPKKGRRDDSDLQMGMGLTKDPVTQVDSEQPSASGRGHQRSTSAQTPMTSDIPHQAHRRPRHSHRDEEEYADDSVVLPQRLSQNERIEKWRRQVAVAESNGKSKNAENSRRGYDYQDGRHNHERERHSSRVPKPKPNANRTQYMVQTQASESSSIFQSNRRRLETERPLSRRRNSRELLRTARNAVWEPSEQDIPPRDLGSATTFNMPSASVNFYQAERERAKVIYTDDREALQGRSSSIEIQIVPNQPENPRRGSVERLSVERQIPKSPGGHTSSGKVQGLQLKKHLDRSSLKAGNLSLDARTDDLQKLFPTAVTVTKPFREIDSTSGYLVSFVFILFSSTKDAAEALATGQGRLVRGQPLSLEYRQFTSH